MNDVTRILSAIKQGDPHAAEQLLPLVYDELRRLASLQMAHDRPGETLNPTALVHEAYLRLVGDGNDHRYHDRGHFFAAAATAMPDERACERGGRMSELASESVNTVRPRMRTPSASEVAG